jgi:hypothetical protein
MMGGLLNDWGVLSGDPGVADDVDWSAGCRSICGKFKGDNTQNVDTWLSMYKQYCSFYDLSDKKSADSFPFHLEGHANIVDCSAWCRSKGCGICGLGTNLCKTGVDVVTDSGEFSEASGSLGWCHHQVSYQQPRYRYQVLHELHHFQQVQVRTLTFLIRRQI